MLRLKEKANTDKMNEPSFLMVITGGEFAYKRPDGVSIVPIGCLRDWRQPNLKSDSIRGKKGVHRKVHPLMFF